MRLIDVDMLMRKIGRWINGKCDQCDDDIEDALTAKPEHKIIYCKDCKNWHKALNKHGCDIVSSFTEPNDFCSFAKRRGDDD